MIIALQGGEFSIMQYNDMSFSQRLKRRLSEKGFTQKQLAEKLNIPETTISSYFRGRSRPDIETITLLADELETTAEYLLTGKKIAPSQLIGELATQLEDSHKRELFEKLIQLTPDNLELAADQLEAILKRQNKEK